jgi:hypothetical protein
MAINKPGDVTNFTEDQIPVMGAMFDQLFDNAAGVKYTDELPTTKTVSEREVVVYDDGAGTKRLYFITAKKNLGYVTLT